MTLDAVASHAEPFSLFKHCLQFSKKKKKKKGLGNYALPRSGFGLGTL